LSPQELDLVRSKLLQEIESTHSKYAAQVEQEVEQFRTAYFKTRHELGLLKTEHEHLKHQQAAIQAEQDVYREAEVGSLKLRIEELHAQLNDTKRDDELRSLRRESAMNSQRVGCPTLHHHNNVSMSSGQDCDMHGVSY
jgi:hypothetical protein